MEERQTKRTLESYFNGQLQTIAEAWDTVEAAEEWGPLPAGKYVADIIGGEMFKSGRKGTPGYKLTFKVIEGDHTGRQFWNDIWVTESAIPMAKRDLAKLGIESLSQLEEALPRVFRCRVHLALRKDDDGTEYNRVKRFDVLSVHEFERDPYAPADEDYVVVYDAEDGTN